MTTIAEAAQMYVEAVETRRALRKQRADCVCDHEAPPEDAANADREKPCWKMVYDDASDADMPYARGAWEAVGDNRDEWCPQCRQRDRIHKALLIANGKIGPAYLRLRFAMQAAGSWSPPLGPRPPRWSQAYRPPRVTGRTSDRSDDVPF